MKSGAFLDAFKEVQKEAHFSAFKKGFWEKVPETGTSLMLVVSELGEACEAYRHGNPPSEKIKAFSHVEEELADVVIRLMDFCEYHKLDLSGAMIAKMEYNQSRPHKHGKEF